MKTIICWIACAWWSIVMVPASLASDATTQPDVARGEANRISEALREADSAAIIRFKSNYETILGEEGNPTTETALLTKRTSEHLGGKEWVTELHIVGTVECMRALVGEDTRSGPVSEFLSFQDDRRSETDIVCEELINQVEWRRGEVVYVSVKKKGDKDLLGGLVVFIGPEEITQVAEFMAYAREHHWETMKEKDVVECLRSSNAWLRMYAIDCMSRAKWNGYAQLSSAISNVPAEYVAGTLKEFSVSGLTIGDVEAKQIVKSGVDAQDPKGAAYRKFMMLRIGGLAVNLDSGKSEWHAWESALESSRELSSKEDWRKFVDDALDLGRKRWKRRQPDLQAKKEEPKPPGAPFFD